MKVTTKIAAVTLIAVTSVANAQMARKEVVLDTGRGGIELKVSVPDFPISGPTDFAGNPGVAKVNINKNGVNVSGQEAGFSAKIGENSFIAYRASTTKTTSTTDKSLSNEKSIAKAMLKHTGQSIEDAQEIPTEFPLLSDGKNVTYKVCSKAVFDNKPTNEFDCSILEVSISNDNKRAVVMMATVSTENLQDHQKTEKQADNAFKYMMKESKALLLP